MKWVRPLVLNNISLLVEPVLKYNMNPFSFDNTFEKKVV